MNISAKFQLYPTYSCFFFFFFFFHFITSFIMARCPSMFSSFAVKGTFAFLYSIQNNAILNIFLVIS